MKGVGDGGPEEEGDKEGGAACFMEDQFQDEGDDTCPDGEEEVFPHDWPPFRSMMTKSLP